MSPSLLNIIPNAVGQRGAETIYAEVVSPAPTSFDDPLYIVMPDWSSDFPFEILGWPAIHGTTLPLVGNEVLLVVDSRGTMRCVWLDGQMTFATQQSQTYYLTPTASDVASHRQMTAGPKIAKTSVAFTNVATGQTLRNYVTQPGVPGVTGVPGMLVSNLAAGQFEFHVHARQTAGNQTVQIFAEFWEYDPNTATDATLICTTQTSGPLTLEETEYTLFFSADTDYVFASPQSRISVHLRALVGGAGGATIVFFEGGAANSHVVVPIGNYAPSPCPTYTTATLPAATAVPPGLIVFVPDGGAGAVFQGSTGSAWVNLG